MEQITLDHKWTCPQIDEIRDNFIFSLSEVIEESNLQWVIGEFKNLVEEFRDINSKMRDRADEQLTELNKDLKSQIEEYEVRIGELQDELENILENERAIN